MTQNLFDMSKALRFRRKRRSLWIDALCINQDDHEVKAVQIGLVKRVYEHAEMVISYVPLLREDEENLRVLIRSIVKAAHES